MSLVSESEFNCNMMSESNYIMSENSVSDSNKSDNNNSEEIYCDAGLIHDVIDSTE